MENNHSNQPPQDDQQLKSFWLKKMEGDIGLKNNAFPLARIKKIMKADPDVNMIAAEAPVLFSKACEMFIMDLTMHSWHHAQENKRITLQRSDIAASVAQTMRMDFLLDVFTEQEPVSDDDDPVAMPDHDVDEMPPGVVIGTPVGGGNRIYASQPSMQAWPGAWTPATGEGVDAAARGNGGNGGN